MEESGFSLQSSWFICERRGLFSLDYYEWGPGKNSHAVAYLMMLKRLIDRILRKSMDPILARRYLSVSQETTERLVNVALKLKKC